MFPVDPALSFGQQAFVPRSCDDPAWRWIASSEADELVASANAAYQANQSQDNLDAFELAEDRAACVSVFLP